MCGGQESGDRVGLAGAPDHQTPQCEGKEAACEGGETVVGKSSETSPEALPSREREKVGASPRPENPLRNPQSLRCLACTQICKHTKRFLQLFPQAAGGAPVFGVYPAQQTVLILTQFELLNRSWSRN